MCEVKGEGEEEAKADDPRGPTQRPVGTSLAVSEQKTRHLALKGDAFPNPLRAAIRASATPTPSGRGHNTSGCKARGVRGLRRHAEEPQVADAVIEATKISEATATDDWYNYVTFLRSFCCAQKSGKNG